MCMFTFIYIYMVVNTYTKSQFPSEYNNAPGKYRHKVFPQSLTAADMKGETMIQKEKCILNNYVKTKIGIFYC